jgi:uncharacterized protein involved in outer membrane biogenesis
VQTTLLGVAIAIILALVSALVAPFVVDWSEYRSTFEEEASRLTGLAVRINGTIDARILPTPLIKLGDVDIGDAGREPQAHAGAIELELGLGPLLRGEVRATELRLIAPQISLGLDRSGAIAWPAPSPTIQADAFTISHLAIEEGRVTLADAESGSRVVLEKLSFDGDIRSFLGPFRGEGAFALGGEPYSYRISGNRAEDTGAFKLRLGLDPANRPLTTEVDGTLSFDSGVPQFEGTLSLARPAGAALAGGERVMSDPWQLAGKVHATPAAALLRDLALQYGPEERAVNFSGSAELTFGAAPHVNGAIAARQLDVDRMLAAPDVTHRPPLVLIKSFLEAFVAAVKPPVPLGLGVTIDAMTVGGTAVQSLHGSVRCDDKGWDFENFAFRAPGLTEVNLSGRLSAGPQGVAFSGPARIESADLKMLMAWLEGRGDRPSGPAESFTARAEVTVANDRLALNKLSARVDQEDVEGRLAYTWAADSRPAALDGELRAPMLDVDALLAFAQAAASDSAFAVPREVALLLDVGQATFSGVDARRVNARIKFDAGILLIDRLSIGDLGGAKLDVSGSLDELSSQPRGRLTLDIDARTLAGLTNIVGRLAPSAAGPLRLFADRLSPAKLHGVLTVDHAATPGIAGKLELGGSLGAVRLALNGEAASASARAEAAIVRVNGRLDADDGGALLRLLDLDSVIAVDQLPGQLTMSASGPVNGDIRFKGVASAGGFSAAAEGNVHVLGEAAPTGSLQLKAAAADLRPLRNTLTGQPGATVPISANAIVGIAGADLTVTDLALTAGKSSVHGRLDLKLANPIRIGGEISADDVDAADVAAVLLGLPSAQPEAGKPWSSAPIGVGGFAALDGSVGFTFDRATLTPSLMARHLKGLVRFRPPEIAFRDINGNLAGGRLTGELTFRRDAPALAGQGRVELSGANAGAFVAPGANAVDGLVTVKLQGDGLGLSQDGLVGSFHGNGTVEITNAQFAGIDPAAFDAAIRAADQASLIEAPKIRAAVSAAMANGRFAAPRGEAEVTIAAGQIRLTETKLRAQGGAELSLDGVLDLNKAAIDTHLTLLGPPTVNALIPTRPELSVSVRGPLAAPERQLDDAALVGWLTLRATEQQTRRLESIEANRRADVLGAASRPPSPSIRFIPQGTVLEMTNRANVAPPLGAAAFDRLRPEPPVAAPASRPDQGAGTTTSPSPAAVKPATAGGVAGADKTTATTGAQPGLRSFFNSLFGSQN